MTGIAIDAKGQKIGRAVHKGDGIHVTLSCLKSQVVEPVRIVWDCFDAGLADYPAVVIAAPRK